VSDLSYGHGGNGLLLSVRDLRVDFAGEHGMVPAVDGLSFDVAAGEVVGLVGESGCGKSVTSLAIMRLVAEPPGRISGGEIRFQGRDLLTLPEREMRQVRGGQIAMVFQEPMTSLDPAFTVGEQVASAYRRHTGVGKRAAWDRAVEMLDLVGIPHARQRAAEYPHMFSGGMRQRVMIAIALSCEPALLIADEPTTALDVTIQAEVLELLRQLQSSMGMAVVLVTHDLGVVSELCDRVVVMYAGQVAETAETRPLLTRPRHPYTHGLLESLPSEHVGETLRPIPGTVPPAHEMPAGCLFHPRCRFAEAGRCDTEPVELRPAGAARWARCVRTDELELGGVDP
jgi:oligopeptide/dipeptide ABC transporter ATP-binding protein